VSSDCCADGGLLEGGTTEFEACKAPAPTFHRMIMQVFAIWQCTRQANNGVIESDDVIDWMYNVFLCTTQLILSRN
jgi:hypothetical protein